MVRWADSTPRMSGAVPRRMRSGSARTVTPPSAHLPRIPLARARDLAVRRPGIPSWPTLEHDPACQLAVFSAWPRSRRRPEITLARSESDGYSALRTNVCWYPPQPRQPASARQAAMTGTEAGCTASRGLAGRRPSSYLATAAPGRARLSERRPGREDGRRDRNGAWHRRRHRRRPAGRRRASPRCRQGHRRPVRAGHSRGVLRRRRPGRHPGQLRRGGWPGRWASRWRRSPTRTGAR